VRAINAIDGHPAVRGQSEQRADAIHVSSIARPRAANRRGPTMKYPGDDLFSQEVAPRVSSALESLTSVFGMGTGGASPLASPGSSSIGAIPGGRRTVDWKRRFVLDCAPSSCVLDA
jgi:hypothetical protein